MNHYQQYEEKLVRQHELRRDGDSAGVEAEDIAEEMDYLWSKLTDQERGRIWTRAAALQKEGGKNNEEHTDTEQG